MNVSTIEHNEAVIEHFAEDPNFAELYLQTVVKDGDEAEIAEVKSWIAHSKNMAYWNNLAENAKIAVNNGLNLTQILSKLNEAVSIVKAAIAQKGGENMEDRTTHKIINTTEDLTNVVKNSDKVMQSAIPQKTSPDPLSDYKKS